MSFLDKFRPKKTDLGSIYEREAYAAKKLEYAKKLGELRAKREYEAKLKQPSSSSNGFMAGLQQMADNFNSNMYPTQSKKRKRR